MAPCSLVEGTPSSGQRSNPMVQINGMKQKKMNRIGNVGGTIPVSAVMKVLYIKSRSRILK
jgi:hypothetical protein